MLKKEISSCRKKYLACFNLRHWIKSLTCKCHATAVLFSEYKLLSVSLLTLSITSVWCGCYECSVLLGCGFSEIRIPLTPRSDQNENCAENGEEGRLVRLATLSVSEKSSVRFHTFQMSKRIICIRYILKYFSRMHLPNSE